ncbi:MAG: hypothetical protein ACREMN_08060 [Gemmatimonadales bacterium]
MSPPDRRHATARCVIAALVALLPARPTAAQAPPALVRFLQHSIGLEGGQLEDALRGESVVRVLETGSQRRDIAIFGMVASDVSRDDFTRRARNFRQALRAPNRTRFGIFGTPATAADVQDVVIAERDVKDMEDCRPGDCVVKLPATDIRRIQAEMNWSAPRHELQEQMNAYARRRLVEYVTDYRGRGDSAMAIYDDRRTANVRSSDAFAELLAESPYIYQSVPSLRDYLTTYPHDTLTGVSEVIFWSEDVLPRLRPILSVTHQVVYTPPEWPDMTVVAAKQIYANHYFEAAVELTGVITRPAGGSYLLVLRRYRFDNLPSGGLLNIRGRATGALRDQLLADLRRQQGERGKVGR